MSGRTVGSIKASVSVFCLPKRLAVVLASIWWLSPVAQAETLRLGLQQALAIGMGQALELSIDAVKVERDRSAVQLSRAAFLPKLNALALGSYAQVGSTIGFISNAQTIGDLNVDLSNNGYLLLQNLFGNIGLGLDYDILNFRRGPLADSSRYQLNASQQGLIEQERSTYFDVTAAYLNLQLASELISVHQRGLQLAEALNRDTEAIRAQGLAAKIDTLQSQALVASRQAELASAISEQAIAASALARLLDLPAKTTVEATDDLTPMPRWRLTKQQTLESALQERPLLEQLDDLQQSALARQRLAKARLLPTLSLLIAGGYSGDQLNTPVVSGEGTASANGITTAVPNPISSGSSFSGGFYDWGLLLSLKQPLFDGGSSASAAAMAEADADLEGLRRQQVSQWITQRVIADLANLEAAALQIDAGSKAIKAGDEAVRDARLRYTAGIAPLTEVLMADRNLQAARSQLAIAIHRWNLARAGLERQTGLQGQHQASGRTKLPDGFTTN